MIQLQMSKKWGGWNIPAKHSPFTAAFFFVAYYDNTGCGVFKQAVQN